MIQLNYRDGRPIYEQVRDGLRQLLVMGAIPPGDKLPSVRSMAAQLAINPNTIQRAYEALEQEGYVYSVPGKGSFAAQRDEIDNTRREELLARLDELAEELIYLGVTPEEIARRCARTAQAGREKKNGKGGDET
ncbi:MAG TPA: GntR family transcriptional regulator [Candidatus Enterenecus stercoripullorum]|nr:GntR family transcriptional regulator [Candidatus Enterenecus stercoripullorum]